MSKGSSPGKPAGRWKPGESGNPEGRKRGTPGQRGRLRIRARGQIAPHVPELVDKALQLALGGDTQALRMLLDRVIPPLKSVAMPTPFPVAPGASLPDQGRAVLDAIAAGTLAPDVGGVILSGLATLARIVADAPALPQGQRLLRLVVDREALPDSDDAPACVGSVSTLPAVRGQRFPGN